MTSYRWRGADADPFTRSPPYYRPARPMPLTAGEVAEFPGPSASLWHTLRTIAGGVVFFAALLGSCFVWWVFG